MIEPEERPADRSLQGLRRSSALFTIVASLVILVVLVSGIYTNVRVVQITNRLQDQQALIKRQQVAQAEQTRIARIASCKQNNQQVVRDRAAFIDNAIVLAAQFPVLTPRQAATIARYIAAQRTRSTEDFPYRDCSPAGIAKFLGQKPPPKG